MVEKLKARAHRRMFNVLNSFHHFRTRISYQKVMIKKVRQMPADNMAIFVYRRAQDRPTVLPVPAWIISAATEKRNAKWGFSYDHSVSA